MNKQLIITDVVFIILIASLIIFYEYELNLRDNDLDKLKLRVTDYSSELNNNLIECQTEYSNQVQVCTNYTSGLINKYNDLVIDYNTNLDEYYDLKDKFALDNNYQWGACHGRPTKLKVCPGCDYWLNCTGSMRPTFSCINTLEFCNPSKEDIDVGEIIMFEIPDKEKYNLSVDSGYIIHRVIGITEGGEYITKGDANYFNDEWTIPFEYVHGTLKSIR